MRRRSIPERRTDAAAMLGGARLQHSALDGNAARRPLCCMGRTGASRAGVAGILSPASESIRLLRPEDPPIGLLRYMNLANLFAILHVRIRRQQHPQSVDA